MMIKLNFLDRLFPPKYNFHQFLSEQAALTARGMQALSAWLAECCQLPDDQWVVAGETGPSPENRRLVIFYADQADEVRLKMEADLIEAFPPRFSARIFILSRCRWTRSSKQPGRLSMWWNPLPLNGSYHRRDGQGAGNRHGKIRRGGGSSGNETDHGPEFGGGNAPFPGGCGEPFSQRPV